MENKVICPEDVIRVLLHADQIPDKATVTKRTGDQEYTLSHNLVVYPIDAPKGLRSERLGDVTTITGFFLVGPRASVNQVSPDKLLHWHVTAEDFVDTLRLSWEGTPQ